RNYLIFFPLKPLLNQPFSHEFFRQLALRLSFILQLLIALLIKITGGVGSMYFVYQVNLPIGFSKFILGINQDQATLGRHFCSTLKHLLVVTFFLLLFFFLIYFPSLYLFP